MKWIIISSDFSEIARSLSTGGPTENKSRTVVADNAVHHDAGN